jgi:antitoxin HigA-1
MKELAPVTPGELLLEEFLVPMGLSQYRLAKEIGVAAQRISEIVAGKRAVSADSDLRLCRFFGLSNGYWLRAQAAYDEERVRSSAMQCAGLIEGKNPERAENARALVRPRIASRHGR